MQRVDRLDGLGTDLVLDGHRPEDPVVADDGEHRGAAGAPSLGVSGQLPRDVDPALAQERRAAHADRPAVDDGLDPRPGSARKSVAVGTSPSAAATIALAIGCSLLASTAAARRRTTSAATSTPTVSRTAGLPFVRSPSCRTAPPQPCASVRARAGRGRGCRHERPRRSRLRSRAGWRARARAGTR